MALVKNEKDSVSLFLNALACFELGDRNSESSVANESVTMLVRLFQMEPNHPEGNFLRGWIHMHDKQYDLALECFDICLKHHKMHLLALQCRAFCFVYLETYDKAIRDCNKLVMLSQTASFAAAFASTVSVASTVSPAQVAVAATLALRGLINLSQRRYDMALLDLNRANETDPHSAMARLYHAECLRKLGRFTEAAEGFSQFIVLMSKVVKHGALTTSTMALALSDVTFDEQEAETELADPSISGATGVVTALIATGSDGKLAGAAVDKGAPADSIPENLKDIVKSRMQMATEKVQREVAADRLKLLGSLNSDKDQRERDLEIRERLVCLERVHRNRMALEGAFTMNKMDIAAVHCLLGILRYNARDATGALEHVDMAIMYSRPQSIALAHVNKGTILLELGKVEDALQEMAVVCEHTALPSDFLKRQSRQNFVIGNRAYNFSYLLVFT
jgi:tetratricopeptide (TPR) repeat protein